MSERFSESKIERWELNEKFVLNSLDRLSRAVESIDAKVGGDLTSMKIEIATLKTKWTIYAAIIGTVAGAAISAFISFILKR